MDNGRTNTTEDIMSNAIESFAAHRAISSNETITVWIEDYGAGRDCDVSDSVGEFATYEASSATDARECAAERADILRDAGAVVEVVYTYI
jgi:hypothetical protein